MNLDYIFNPKSVAIIGASTRPGSVGNDLTKNIASEFAGNVYPVNPNATELYGKKCYPSLNVLPKTPELIVVAVPAPAVIPVMEQAGQMGVKAVVVVSAGFKEAGNLELEEQLIAIASKYDMALVGPNCLGIISPKNKLNASFAPVTAMSGKVAFISQSGALCTAVLDYANKLGIGFSKFMSIGNKASLQEADILSYLKDDPDTEVIAMYIEDFKNGKRLLSVLKSITHGSNAKPIIVIKSGKTAAGAGASASHTGALAGNDAVYNALFSQTGVIRVESTLEMFEYLRVFCVNPKAKGKNIGLITNAGGPGVIATDEAVSFGLKLAKLSVESVKTLKAGLPPFANIHNPVDVLGDAKADRYELALRTLVKDKNVDMIGLILTPQAMTEIKETAEKIVAIRKETNKPLVVSFMGGRLVKEAVQYMQESSIATVAFPEQAMRAMGALAKFSVRSKEKIEKIDKTKNPGYKKVVKIFADAKKENRNKFPEAEALQILSAYGFKTLRSGVVTTAVEAEKLARKIGKNVVLKIVSPDILHKTDVGGVMLDIAPTKVRNSFSIMMKTVKKNCPKADIQGILVVEMVKEKGAEMIVGSMREPGLGNLVMVGLGGVYVEVFKDVAFGVAPITPMDAECMINRLKSVKILDGVRGGEKLDKVALKEVLLKLSNLLEDFPEIKELDMNPVLVTKKGVKTLDARIIID